MIRHSLQAKLNKEEMNDLRSDYIYGAFQHHQKLRDLRIGGILVESGDEEATGYPKLAFDLLTVSSKGNAALLEELLKSKLDPDIGDSKGRTPLVCFF